MLYDFDATSKLPCQPHQFAPNLKSPQVKVLACWASVWLGGLGVESSAPAALPAIAGIIVFGNHKGIYLSSPQSLHACKCSDNR